MITSIDENEEGSKAKEETFTLVTEETWKLLKGIYGGKDFSVTAQPTISSILNEIRAPFKLIVIPINNQLLRNIDHGIINQLPCFDYRPNISLKVNQIYKEIVDLANKKTLFIPSENDSKFFNDKNIRLWRVDAPKTTDELYKQFKQTISKSKSY